MDDLTLTRSVAKDLQDVGVLFLRRQCSVGVLRVNFDRATTRLRWVSPESAEILRTYIAEIDKISARPSKEHFVAVSDLLHRFDRWIKEGAKPPVQPIAAPKLPSPPLQSPADVAAPPPAPPAPQRASEPETAAISTPAPVAEAAPAPASIVSFDDSDGVPVPPEDDPDDSDDLPLLPDDTDEVEEPPTRAGSRVL